MAAKHFWLSFADPERPSGQQFLGATVVEAADGMEAIRRAWELGINPGGEVQMVEIPADRLDELLRYRDRLVSKKELNEAGEVSNYDQNRATRH